MGQQYSLQTDGSSTSTSSHNPSSGNKMKIENTEKNPVQTWGNNISSSVSSITGRNEQEIGENSSNKPKLENELSRMSIRAAIDTFIENCLSAHNDYPPHSDDKPADDTQINMVAKTSSENIDNQKTECGLSRSINLNSSTDDIKNEQKITDSEVIDIQDNDEQKYADVIELATTKHLLLNVNNSQTNDSKDGLQLSKDGIQHSKDSFKLPKDGIQQSNMSSPQSVQAVESDENIKKVKTHEHSSSENSNVSTLIAQPKPPEKKTFSAYLQERLKTVDLDKHEELTRLALSKDIQCQGQMFMWEMTKKPVDVCDIASTSADIGSNMFTSGPVRLQTVIDRVLDNSLRKQEQPPSTNNTRRKDENITQEQDVIKTPSVLLPQEIAPGIQREPKVNVQDPAKARLCFKDHIEKVLVESFLSFEEEERREVLKSQIINDQSASETQMGSNKVGNSKAIVEKDKVNCAIVENRMLLETDRLIGNKDGNSRVPVETEKLSSNKGGNKSSVETDRLSSNRAGGSRVQVETDKLGSSDGTISVQDIVDQVISQTEMISQLFTPARDINKQTPSSGQSDSFGQSDNIGQSSDISGQSYVLSTQSNTGHKYPSSNHNRVLLEAQRHAVQKEHQSSTNLGRKRGRPRLGSPVNTSIKCTPEPIKDMKSSYNDMRSSQILSQANDHPHIIKPSRDYILTNHHPSGTSGGLSSSSSKNMVPSSSGMFQQSHHIMQNSSYAVKKFLTDSASPGYQLNINDGFHHHYGGHHLPTHPSSQQHQSRHSVQIPSSNPPSPHTLADRGKDNNRLVQVSHIPTKSCSCHSCLAHFSKMKSPSQVTHIQQYVHQPVSKMDNSGEHAHHISLYQHYPSGSSHLDSVNDFYSHPVAASKEIPNPGTAVSGQNLSSHTTIPPFLTAQRHQEAVQLPTSKESAGERHYLSGDYLPGIYQAHQSLMSQATAVKPILLDSRFDAVNNGIQIEHIVYEDDSFQRVTRDKGIHIEAPVTSKVKEHNMGASISQDIDQPLDLSVKPAHNRDTRTYFESGADLPKQDTGFCVQKPNYRLSSSDLPSKGNGQYIEYEQGPSGHHLQKLENSVDRFLFHRHPQPQLHQSLYSSSPQQRQKTHSLHSTHQTHQDEHGVLQHSNPSHDHHYLEMLSQDQPASGYKSSLHHSPVSLAHPSSPALQQLPLTSQSHRQNSAESPSNRHYQTRSPGLNLRQHSQKNIDTPHQLQPNQSSTYQAHFMEVLSAAGDQLSSIHNLESKEEGTLTDSAYASSPAHLHRSPSPEDNQKLYKHEPIQNIIGNHAPSDILYLICLLCRQTYGSPYGFRKHFRNQHGFEPKADHTIVQTISATKTARAHTGPSDAIKKALEPQFVKEDQFQNDHLYFHGHPTKSSPLGSIVPPSQPSLKHSAPSDDIKSELMREIPMITKCLECPECSQTFQLNDFGSYKRHCRQHSLHRSSGPFACHECERSFSEPSFLQEHLATHSSFTPSVCGICRTFFSSPNYLAGHLQAAHGIVNGSENRQRYADINKSSDSIKKSELLSLPTTSSSTSNRSTSLPDYPVMSSPSSLNHIVTPSTIGHSSIPSVIGAAPSSLHQSPVALTLGHSPAPSTLLRSTAPSPLHQRFTPSTLGLSSVPSTVGLSSVPSTLGLSSVPSTVGLSPVLSTLGISSFPSTLDLSSVPSLGLSSGPSTVGHSSLPSTLDLSSVPTTLGLSSVPSTLGLISTPPTAGDSSTPIRLTKNTRLSENTLLRSSSASPMTHGPPSASSMTHGPPSTSPMTHGPPSASSMTHGPPFAKRHDFNTPTRDPHMLTFHTPKGLEIQKLPADAVVTAASPDSSCDEGKHRLDHLPAGNISQTDGMSDKLSPCQSSSSFQGNKIASAVNAHRKTDNYSKCNHKDETESNSSDRSTSMDSANFSLDDAHSSPQGTNETDKLYQHKKYSRHRKRLTSNEISSEHHTKSQKVDESSNRKDQVSFLVSSTGNSGVTIQDCESSCSLSEDSDHSWKGQRPDQKLPQELKIPHKQGETTSEFKGRKPDICNSKLAELKCEEAETTFKWDRQTRSQAGKSLQPISYTQ